MYLCRPILKNETPEVRLSVNLVLRSCLAAYLTGQVDWIQGAHSASVEGRPCSVWDPSADAFSLDGIVQRLTIVATQGMATTVEYKVIHDKVNFALNCLILTEDQYGSTGLRMWNNRPLRTFADVSRLLKTAIEETSCE